MRRYEILLPVRYNDGTPVPRGLIGDVIIALRQRFCAASCETQTIRGVWEHEGEVFQDDLMRVFVDVPDTEGNREWFRTFKEQLKKDFDQLDIWLTTHPIDVL